MIPIAFPINLAVSLVAVSITVTDVTYITVNGEMKQSSIVTRTIKAAVDPSNGNRLENIFGGNVSDGDIGVIPVSRVGDLYIGDQFDGTKPQNQSFVVYNNLNYRVVQKANWINQANINVYLCKRHVIQDVI